MSELLERLLQESKALTADERAVLADALLSDGALPNAEWEDAWAAECQRRLASLADGSAAAIPWEEVKPRLRSR